MPGLRSSHWSRREFLAVTAAAAFPGAWSGESLGARFTSAWSWELQSPHRDNPAGNAPLPRDPWNALLGFDGVLYLFGGVFPKYGPPRGPGDLTTMGSLNDLWRFDPAGATWACLHQDDGQADFDPRADRPCGRVLPCWVEVQGKFYLFGGLTAYGEGWQTRLLNDFWCYDPSEDVWTLLEPDDDRNLQSPGDVSGDRPTALAAMGTAVIDDTIYLFAGWGGQQPKVVLSEQLWSYKVTNRRWTFHGGSNRNDQSPAKRYCPAMTSFDGRLFLWAGRDTQDLNPQWYNDLWSYDPNAGRWVQLAGNGPGSIDASRSRPAARYAMGEARLGDAWYIMGGFGADSGNSPQLNDLWKLDLESARWELVQACDFSKDASESAGRPCVRRVPAMTSMDDAVYLFGGLDLTSGPR